MSHRRERRFIIAPPGAVAVSVRLALSADVVAEFKFRYGWRWKLAMNAALRDWLTTHNPAELPRRETA